MTDKEDKDTESAIIGLSISITGIAVGFGLMMGYSTRFTVGLSIIVSSLVWFIIIIYCLFFLK